jgi:hypothetical protein
VACPVQKALRRSEPFGIVLLMWSMTARAGVPVAHGDDPTVHLRSAVLIGGAYYHSR